MQSGFVTGSLEISEILTPCSPAGNGAERSGALFPVGCSNWFGSLPYKFIDFSEIPLHALQDRYISNLRNLTHGQRRT